MRKSVAHSIELHSRKLDYRVIRSRTAKYLRVRVTPNGVEVIQPRGRTDDDVSDFLRARADWIRSQVSRMDRLTGLRKPITQEAGTMLLRGERIKLLMKSITKSRINRVRHEDGALTIEAGTESPMRQCIWPCPIIPPSSG